MKLVVLSGGVGGARLGRGLARLEDVETTMVVNVGDDEVTYGLHVSPDLDTVLYTIAGIEGPEGWGRADDTWEVMGHLSKLGIDTTFAIGDSDLATNLFRTLRLRQRESLSSIVSELATRFGLTDHRPPRHRPTGQDEDRHRRWTSGSPSRTTSSAATTATRCQTCGLTVLRRRSPHRASSRRWRRPMR